MIVSRLHKRAIAKCFHFSNAEILLFNTNSPIQLVPAVTSGQTYKLREVSYLMNQVQKYTNIDAAAEMQIYSGFSYGGFLSDTDDMVTVNGVAIKNLFANSSNGLITSYPSQNRLVSVGAQQQITHNDVNDGLDLAILAGNIHLNFINGGADLTGGDPDNYLEIWLDYDLVWL
jgi:hypothetical protein